VSNIRHSSASADWGTPKEIMTLVHDILGTIDLDPASDLEFNKVVQAKRVITKEENSLVADWGGSYEKPITIFLNPPSAGKLPGNKSYAGVYWAKLMDFALTGKMKDAIFLGFSLEQLAVTQNYHERCMCQFTSCVPKRRTKFYKHDSNKISPTHSNIIVYVPGRIDQSFRFEHVFSQLGCIINKPFYCPN
jgi:hypothetical protein